MAWKHHAVVPTAAVCLIGVVLRIDIAREEDNNAKENSSKATEKEEKPFCRRVRVMSFGHCVPP